MLLFNYSTYPSIFSPLFSCVLTTSCFLPCIPSCFFAFNFPLWILYVQLMSIFTCLAFLRFSMIFTQSCCFFFFFETVFHYDNVLRLTLSSLYSLCWLPCLAILVLLASQVLCLQTWTKTPTVGLCSFLKMLFIDNYKQNFSTAFGKLGYRLYQLFIELLTYNVKSRIKYDLDICCEGLSLYCHNEFLSPESCTEIR